MSLKTLEQERAKFAYERVIEVKNNPDASEYRSYVRGFGAMILQNGLGQALAFLRAKGKNNQNDPHNILYNHINQWLGKNNTSFDILKKIIEEDSSKYRLYTKEALAFLVWLRKFTEAELPEKEK